MSNGVTWRIRCERTDVLVNLMCTCSFVAETLEDDDAASDDGPLNDGKNWEILVDPSDVEEEQGAMVLHVAGTRLGLTCCR